MRDQLPKLKANQNVIKTLKTNLLNGGDAMFSVY